MKKYVKKYIKFIARVALKIKLPFFVYAIVHTIRRKVCRYNFLDSQHIKSLSIDTFHENCHLILSFVKAEGTGLGSAMNLLIRENKELRYFIISWDGAKFSTNLIYKGQSAQLGVCKNPIYAIDKIAERNNILQIHIHHVRMSFDKTLSQHLHTLNIPIYTHLHDFFFACPSMFLMDDKNKFCNLDKQKDCHKCSIIQAATSPFSNIEMNSVSQFRNINSWRETSQKLFDISSKIIAYSQTTIDMYKKIFKIPEEKIEISNALLSSSIHFKKLPKDYNLQKFDKINIAMIGSWHYVKGSEVFKEMEKIINTNKNLYQDVNLYFIGKGFCDIRSKIKNLGIYNSQNLATIIQENKISICFVPSICCETFSITTQDCIEVGIPIATFGIGAMKERLLGLKNALIINEVTNENIRNFTNKEIANIAIKNILNFVQNKNNIAN